MDTIAYRSTRPSDFPYLRKMFGDAFALWHYSDDPRVMRHLLSHYLYAYLVRSSYVEVAAEGDEAVGFLFGRYDGHVPLWRRVKYSVLKAYHALMLLGTSTQNVYFHGLHMIAKADEAMKEGQKEPFDSELVLFVVDAKMRHRGIGEQLLEHFRAYLNRCGAKKLYLFTDDYSNVNFYRNKGYLQESECALTMDDGNARFYLFAVDVPNM